MSSNKIIALLITLHMNTYVSNIHPIKIVSNQTYGERAQDMWISSINGDLSIRNLQMNDNALYKCEYRGLFSEPTELRIGKIPVLHE